MKRFLIYTLLIVGGVGLGWQYLPPDVRTKTSAFIGTVFRGDRQGVQDFIGNEILPKDPEEKRGVLLGKLKEKMSELKNKTVAKPGVLQSTANKTGIFSDNSAAEKLLQEADDIIRKLQGVNTDASVGSKVVDRILDKVFSDGRKTLTQEEIKQICEENK